MEDVALAYGKSSVRVRVPEPLVPPRSMLAARAPPSKDPGRLYRYALDTVRWEIADPVCVVVPDETRPSARIAAVEALADVLTGHSADVLVGSGLHPAFEFEAPWPCHVHDAHASDLVPLGESAGIAVEVNPIAAAAATVIVVSSVLPHYLAGFSGGPKGLVPGVAGEQTILAVHRLADTDRTGVVARNPFARAIRSCASLFSPRCYGLNLLVGPRGPFAATAGELLEAHSEAVRIYRDACTQPRPEPADVVVADAGGHPVDATLLQAHKAYEAAAGLVLPGGTIILVAACDEGFGHYEFERRLLAKDPPAGPFHPYARTAEEWHRKARSIRTLMVTELDTTGLGVERVALEVAVERIPRGARVLWAQRAQDLLFR
jgi:hypothetical protein